MQRADKTVPPDLECNISPAPATNLISELGWTREEAAQVRASLQAFEADWNAPGMEEYDRL